ncbi:hypothetical protein Ancab_021338 [Ancistrocladus abbreviatus]
MQENAQKKLSMRMTLSERFNQARDVLCFFMDPKSKPEPGCRFMYDRIEDKEEPVDPTVASQGDYMVPEYAGVSHALSFYPLYPPAEGAPLDFSIAPEALSIPSLPHILILPPDLSPFIKVLSLKSKGEGKQQTSCICVNPGRLAKGTGGGTFDICGA